MSNFFYVYILESEENSVRHYIGFTEDLQGRLQMHNRGQVPHSSKHKPWKIKNAIAFRERTRALAFERYLKSGSGRAFARRHF